MENVLDTQLEKLSFFIIEMGALIERAVACAATGFIKRNTSDSRKVAKIIGEINTKEKEIESLAMKLLLRSPTPKQLRKISAVLKMITDLKRIGDRAGEISELALLISDEPYGIDMFEIPDMARCTVTMSIDAIHAFVHDDINMALEVKNMDDRVDSLFLTERERLITTVRENVDRASCAFDFLMIAKYFERIGDHTSDVAEWVIYSITGKHTDKFD